MNYEELNTLWKNQRSQCQLWGESLSQQAGQLCSEISKLLNIERELWEDPDTGQMRRYVDLYDISDKPEPNRGLFSNKSFTIEGELIFGIAITFEHDFRTYPKKVIYMPVAVRFANKVPEYSFFDSQTKKSEPPWERDIIKFSATLIERMADYLRFDPFEAAPVRSSIGFI